MSGPLGRWSGDVLVIGAGPAGWAAAGELGAAGLDVLVVDENPQAGGQIGRVRFGAAAAVAPPGPRVRFVGRVTCHGFLDGDEGGRRAVLSTPSGVLRARARAVVVATGGLERVVPLPGWTTPGVMTAGAAQTFVKGSGRFPHRSVVLAGTGPLLLPTAAQLLGAGVRIAALAEAMHPTAARAGDLARLLWAPELLAQGAGYGAALLRGRVPVATGTGVSRVVGTDRVTGALLRPLARDGSFAGPERLVGCDAVVLSHGFVANTELVAQAGARLAWDEPRRTWTPVRDPGCVTTEPDVVAVGDCTGVGGAQVARLEGQLAGAALARRLTGRSAHAGRTAWRRRRLARLRRFRVAMDRLFPVPPGAVTWADPSTVVCRCEESVQSEVTRALDAGVRDLHGLKLWTRAGMGPCQGRTCAPALLDLLTARGAGPGAPPPARFPVRPLPAGALVDVLSALDGVTGRT